VTKHQTGVVEYT
jgi:nicotinamidase-related amidase